MLLQRTTMNSSARAFCRKRDYIAGKPNTLIKVFDRLYNEVGSTERAAFYDQINSRADDSLSCNPNITWEFVNKHSTIKWNPHGISLCPNITWDIIKENLYSDYWLWREISTNPNITWNIVKNHPLLPWDIDGMSVSNPSIVWDDIREYTLINRNASNFKISYLLANKSITPEIIGTDPVFDKMRLGGYGFANNPNTTLDHILDILPNNDAVIKTGEKTMVCSFDNFSKNPNITWAFVKKYGTGRPWKHLCLAKNINFSIEELYEFWNLVIKRQIDQNWRHMIIQNLCANVNITWKMICATMSEIKWNWFHIAHFNTNITVDVFEQLLQMRPPAERTALIQNYLSNPNVTYEFICANWPNDFQPLWHNKYLWDDAVYERSIKAEIKDRRGMTKNVLNSTAGTAFDCVARYIDYA